METRMKPCPFCGQDAVRLDRAYSNRSKKYFTWIECDVCGARSKAVTSNDDPESVGWDNMACRKAVSAWNVRVENG